MDRQPAMPHGIQAVLFDAVGTLMEPSPPVAEVYRVAARDVACDLPLEQVRRRFRQAFARRESKDRRLCRYRTSEADERHRWRAIVADVFPEVRPPVAGQLLETLWQHFAEHRHWALFADVANCLAQLSARGLELAIASNFDGRLEGIVAGFPELADCRGRVFTSAQIGYRKPAREFFAEIQARLNLAGEQILLVGDDPQNDFVGGRQAGWRAVHLVRGRPASQSPSLSTLADLPRWIAAHG